MDFEEQFTHIVNGCLEWINIISCPHLNPHIRTHFEGINDIQDGLVEFQYSTNCMSESDMDYESIPLEILMIEDTNKRNDELKAIWHRELQLQKEGKARLEAELAEKNKKRDLATLKALKGLYPDEEL